MLAMIQGSTQGLKDVEHFLQLLERVIAGQVPAARGLFNIGGELVVTRAPGRLDVMGGIADYSGSQVLQWPIAESTRVALQRRSDRRVRVVSLGEDAHRGCMYELDLARLENRGEPVDYPRARSLFRRKAEDRWAAYALGALIVLARERRVSFPQGADMLITSDVPEGKGVSSSAALEVAVMQAVAAAYDVAMTARECALLCQQVENHVVGAPCGVMDQMTAACGRAGELLALLCQPAELLPPVAVPPDLELWGLDSGIRHSVSGADYASVRTGAFMGYRMIAEWAGLSVETGQGPASVRIDDPRWHGYLANLTPSEFQQHYADRLPVTLSGGAFLDRYAGTSDTVTQPARRRKYAVRQPTAHPIYEHWRVRSFVELLICSSSEKQRELLGELMYQCHASYSACGLGCEGTDLLVSMVRQMGPARGLYGAKITGGGSGGTVAILGRRGAGDAVQEIADCYAQQRGYRPILFTGSSPGAAQFGHLRLANPS